MDNYYNQIANGYNELHGEEQRKKMAIIKKTFLPEKNDILLDFGCGTGLSSDWDCNVIGIDPNFELLKKNPRIKVQGIGENMPFKKKSIDHLISLTAFHHVTDIDLVIEQIDIAVKKKIIISILKKSKKCDEIISKLKKKFPCEKIIEEEKDLIVFAK